MIRISVIILNWNGKHFLEKFLPSVVKHSSLPDVEIVVADNGSTDDSVEFLENQYPKITLLKFDRNFGFAEGYNRALQQIESEYYVLLNSDVEVTGTWIQPIIQLMDSDKKIAACMPKIRDFNNRKSFEYAGASGGFIDRYGYTFCRGRIFNIIEEDNKQYDDTREVFWASGASLFIRADAFHQAGGLDGKFFAHMEEIDLCWRLKNRGFRISSSGQSLVYHVGGGALPMNHPRKTYLNFRNNLYLLYKNLPAQHFKRTMLSRLLLDIIAAVKFLFSLEFSNFLSVFRAHISFFSSLPRLKTDRQENLKKAVTFQHPEIYPHSIVIDFFIRSKKRFSDLSWSE